MPFIGGVAESVVVDTNYVFPLPDSVSFASAAALPLNYLTAHFALVRRANLQPGETVLVQGAGGGVGSASCNMAAALGAKVIAVVSSAEKAAVAEAAGAHHVVLADGFPAEVRRLTEVAVSTWSWTLLAENDSPTRYARSREKVGCSSSASPEDRSL